VVWKIARHRSFLWLVQRQLWTLAAAVLLFAITPVDAIVHTFNVRRVLAGDLAPSVQISVHPISAEGILVLPPLLECDDPIIREGIRALLAQRAMDSARLAAEQGQFNWTAYQGADAMLQKQLAATQSRWSEYQDDAKRRAALKRFHAYVYQWY
jgi:Arc/MetJ-type ribon-helix-helix transcriptional regulator